MKITRNPLLSLSLLLAAAASAFAQTDAAGKRPAPDDAGVTISISAGGVRFSAPGSVGRVRLEVFDASGASVYNSEFQPGNVRDWALQDKQGQALADGSYLCVVTVRGLSKRMSVRQGTVVIQGGQASLQLSEGEQVGAVESEKSLSQVAPDASTAGTLLAHDGKVGQVVSTSGALTFRVGDFFGGKDKELMRLTSEGDLGVGTSKPQAKLDVAGTIRARGGIVFDDGTALTSSAIPARVAADGTLAPAVAGTGTTNRLTKWTDNAGTLGDSVLTEVGGRIGVGTTTPAFKLDLVDSTSGAGGFQLANNTSGASAQLQNRLVNDTGALAYYGITSSAYTQAPILSNRAFFGSYQVDTMIWTQTANDIIFATNGLGANSERMRLTSAGNFGIGTNAPAAKLDVVGDIKVSGNAVIAGNIAAKYQDVAEWVPARQQIAAGTVVILDVTRSNGVEPSNRRYDTHVAGVVSAQPGVILGQGGEGQVLVATTGRVKVRVDATRHPVRIGDLLVTGDAPGSAMKSLPVRVGGNRLHRPGTIIGKALEPLTKGKGEILVLLSLQ